MTNGIGAIIAAGVAQRTWNRLGAGAELPRSKRTVWPVPAFLVAVVALGKLVWMFVEAIGS